MKKINTLSKQMNILTAAQMSVIKGGTISTIGDNLLSNSDLPAASVGPISATVDDKRRDRPGGGVSTH